MIGQKNNAKILSMRYSELTTNEILIPILNKSYFQCVDSPSYNYPGHYKRPREAPAYQQNDFYHGIMNSKRKCSANNDILSSLSSSRKLNRSSSESSLIPPSVVITPPQNILKIVKNGK